MKIKTFFTRFFTWWNGQTFGTQVWTSLYGEFVGEDEFGNRYYRTKGGKIDPSLGFERRWVIYRRLRRGLRDPAVMARLDASHRRCAADRRKIPAVGMGKAASREPDRHARRATADRLDALARPSPESDRRLQGVGAGREKLGAGAFQRPPFGRRIQRVNQPHLGSGLECPQTESPEARCSATNSLRPLPCWARFAR